MNIRNPKFGNTWSIDARVKTSYSAGGNLLQVRDADWPKYDSFSVTFEALSNEQRLALENLLVNTAGDELELTDFEGRTWLGVFTTDPIVFTNMGRFCQWTISLDFTGFITALP